MSQSYDYQQARRKRGAEGALAPPVFGRTVNPMYLNQGEQIMPTTVLRAPPDFQTLRRPCTRHALSKKKWQRRGLWGQGRRKTASRPSPWLASICPIFHWRYFLKGWPSKKSFRRPCGWQRGEKWWTHLLHWSLHQLLPDRPLLTKNRMNSRELNVRHSLNHSVSFFF